MMRTRRGRAPARAVSAGAAALVLLTVAGCDRIGSPIQALTGKRTAPDEFQVIQRKPLQMPPSAALPVPQPGARSPLDPDPNRDAVVALMGTDTRMAAAGASAGEQALLSAANAAASEPEIREVLESDRENRATNEPYEPPLIWEVLGGGRKEKPKDAIDATAEARRLQTQGVAATPVDPREVPPSEEAEAAPAETSQYPTSTGGRPRNKLPSSQPVPAF